MKEQLLDIVRDSESPVLAGNLAREYLQARILLALQEAGAMIPLAFQGGTALRFLFGLPRFSEDLDFALERPERSPFDLAQVEGRIRARLERGGYEVKTRRKADRVFESLLVSFPGLLYESGLSPHKSQRLSIRIELDTKPPAGAGLTTTIVRRHALLNLQHHDRPSLLSGKLHAILQRGWTKGRDLERPDLARSQPQPLEQRPWTDRLGGVGARRPHLEACGAPAGGIYGLGCRRAGRLALPGARPRHRAFREGEPPEDARGLGRWRDSTLPPDSSQPSIPATSSTALSIRSRSGNSSFRYSSPLAIAMAAYTPSPPRVGLSP